MKTTHYRLPTEKPGISFRAAIVADVHDRAYDRVLPILERERPDLILIPGDLCERLDRVTGQPDPVHPGELCRDITRPGLGLLPLCAAIAPTYYAFGNHEVAGCHGNIYKTRLAGGDALPPFHMADHWRQIIRASGACHLDEGFVRVGDLVVGGLGSGLINPGWVPKLDWIAEFAATPGYKLLICHHPEYFDRYLRPYDIDLIVSGHAHGGQWRIFGRGVYAPDQPLFPKYTSGVHEGRLVISRGVVNSVPAVPRFFNPCEVVIVEVSSVSAPRT